MWELDYKESWVLKNWCFWTMVLEKTLERPLDCKEIQPVHPKGNQSWIFIGRTDAEAETPILWPPDRKNWLTGKDPDAGKDWRREEKGMTEDEMVEWTQLTQRTWVWVSSRELVMEWKPGVLQSMGSQTGLNWTGLSNWTELSDFHLLHWFIEWHLFVLQLDSSYVGSISLLSVWNSSKLSFRPSYLFPEPCSYTCIVLLIPLLCCSQIHNSSLTFSSELWTLRTTLSLLSSLGY